MITARAVVKPRYLNASRDFSRWFSHNWRMLEQYFEQLGGDKTNVKEYLEFCRCQYDQQEHSPRDEALVYEVEDENARIAASNRCA